MRKSDAKTPDLHIFTKKKSHALKYVFMRRVADILQVQSAVNVTVW